MRFPLLTEKESVRAMGLSREGIDTRQIASIMDVTEAEVYNSLYRLKELHRDRWGARHGAS